MLKAQYLILPALVLAQAAMADTVKLRPSALEMPDHIGPLQYTGKHSSWPDKAGQGAARRAGTRGVQKVEPPGVI
jgi:hypothetical protein